MEEKYPFTFTPPIIRYIKEIITVFENRKLRNIKNTLPFSVCFESYEKNELFQHNSENTRKAFIKYLEEQGTVKIELIKITDTRVFDDLTINKDKAGDFETNFVLHILNMSKIYELFNCYTKSKG